jgi:hypothetical protein
MPTVIDSLIVTLGLDPSSFNKGQKEAASSFLKTRDAALKSGKEIEESAKRTANAISKIAREVLALFAVIAGGRSIKDFATELISANSELGRFSANMAESPQTIAAWGAAAERAGGSAAATVQTIERMSRSLYDLRYSGKALPDAFFQLEAATKRMIRTDQGPIEFLNETAAALQQLAKTDPNRAYNIAEQLGIDPGTFNLMKQQGAAISAYVAEVQKSIAPSNDAIKASQQLQSQWAALEQTFAKVANELLPKLEQVLGPIIEKMTNWVSTNQEWIDTKIVEGVQSLADAVRSIDWKAISQGLHEIGMGAAGTAGVLASIADSLHRIFDLSVSVDWSAIGLGKAKWSNISPKEKPTPGLFSGATRFEPDASDLPGFRQPGSGPLHRYRRRPSSVRPDDDLSGGAGSTGLRGDAGKDTLVDGRPVNKSNPMPVTIADQQGGGGGFWSNLFSSIGSALTGGAGGMFGGGGGSGSAPQGGGGDGGSDNAAPVSVPNVPMTTKERNTLGLILKYESKGRNVMNYMGRAQHLDPATPKGYTAQGYFQMLNSNWNRIAPKLGIKTKNAMAASLEDQTKVALYLLRHGGVGNWANFNPALRAALARGEKAGKWAESVPVPKAAEATSSKPRGDLGVATGARGAASLSTTANDNRVSNSSTAEVKINNINVHTAATDANGIAKGIGSATEDVFRSGRLAAAANYGLRP